MLLSLEGEERALAALESSSQSRHTGSLVYLGLAAARVIGALVTAIT